MTALQEPQKNSKILVELRFGDPAAPTFLRMTDFTSDVLGPSNEVYSSRPTLKIGEVVYTATLDEEQVSFYLTSDTLFDRMSNGEPFSPVFVKILEVLEPPGGSKQTLTLHRGRVFKVTSNYEGKTGQVQVESHTIKKDIQDIALGFPATPDCPWVFGDLLTCQVDLGPITETGTVTVVDRRKITITGLTAPVDKYWHRGVITIDGLAIGVRDWKLATPEEFIMSREVPQDWAGEACSAVPGCDKSLPTCITRWNNEARFGGSGIAIPPFSPIFENN